MKLLFLGLLLLSAAGLTYGLPLNLPGSENAPVMPAVAGSAESYGTSAFGPATDWSGSTTEIDFGKSFGGVATLSSLWENYKTDYLTPADGDSYGGASRDGRTPPTDLALHYASTQIQSGSEEFGKSVSLVPEPTSLILFAAGLTGIAVWRRRRRA